MKPVLTPKLIKRASDVVYKNPDYSCVVIAMIFANRQEYTGSWTWNEHYDKASAAARKALHSIGACKNTDYPFGDFDKTAQDMRLTYLAFLITWLEDGTILPDGSFNKRK